jgi:hypothetical protein
MSDEEYTTALVGLILLLAFLVASAAVSKHPDWFNAPAEEAAAEGTP